MIGWIAVLLVPGVIGLVTERLSRCGGPVTAGLQLLLPWWVAVAVAVTAVAVITRTWWLAVAGALVAGAIAAVITPKLRRGRQVRLTPSGSPPFSIGLANLYLDNPEPEGAIEQLLAAAPAVLVLTELTPDLLAAFDRAGGADRYPHRLHPEPLEGDYEAGIFSVYPFAQAEVHVDGPLRVVDATVELPDAAVRVLAVHPEAPTGREGFRRWRAQLATLRTVLERADPATVVLGDFNAGTLQPPYEQLLQTTFRDAHDALGRALSPSWGVAPALPSWVPTFVARLDHLLVGSAVDVVDLRDLDPVGSDHRPFVASLAVRR